MLYTIPADTVIIDSKMKYYTYSNSLDFTGTNHMKEALFILLLTARSTHPHSNKGNATYKLCNMMEIATNNMIMLLKNLVHCMYVC